MFFFLWETSHTFRTKGWRLIYSTSNRAVARSVLFIFFPGCTSNLRCRGCIAHAAIPHVLALAGLLVADKAYLNFCRAMFQHLKQTKKNAVTEVKRKAFIESRFLTRKPFTYVKEDADGVASAYGVLVLLQVFFERYGIASLYDLHAHTVQGLDRFMDGTVLLFVVCVAKPGARMGSIESFPFTTIDDGDESNQRQKRSSDAKIGK